MSMKDYLGFSYMEFKKLEYRTKLKKESQVTTRLPIKKYNNFKTLIDIGSFFYELYKH